MNNREQQKIMPINLYNINKLNFDSTMYQYKAAVESEKHKEFDSKKMMNQIHQFENISTAKDAKELAKKFWQIKEERTTVYSGDYNCTIIDQNNFFRVSLETPTDFISYDYTE